MQRSIDPGSDARLDSLAGSLHSSGSTLLFASRGSSAAVAFERAALTAEVRNHAGLAASARFWQGVSLHGLGRLRAAFLALAEVVTSREPASIEDRILHMTLTRYVLAAVDVPLRLDTIDRALADIDRIERHNGRARRSRLLLVRARLANARGSHREAFELAREGLARARSEDPCFANGAYIKDAALGALRAGNLDDVEPLIRELEATLDSYAVSRRINAATYRSLLARRQGRFEPAVEWALRAVDLARQSDELFERTVPDEALVRSLIAIPDSVRARPVLARLLRRRHAEPGLTRYAIRLLRADFHLALARSLAGLPPLDPETGLLNPPGPAPDITPAAPTPVDARAARHQAGRARRAFIAAGRVGAPIDEALACRVRETEISGRLALVDEVFSALARRTRSAAVPRRRRARPSGRGR